MSWHQHSGWPVSAINKLRRAKKLKKLLEQSTHAKVADNPEIEQARKDAVKAREMAEALENKYRSLLAKEAGERRTSLPHINAKIEKLAREAKWEREAVPERIIKFIQAISNGVDWSAGFQIVWWDPSIRFVILRLPGRKYWSARSQAYAATRYSLYDLDKFTGTNTRRGNFGAIELEEKCRLREHEGAIKPAELKDWKETANYVAT